MLRELSTSELLEYLLSHRDNLRPRIKATERSHLIIDSNRHLTKRHRLGSGDETGSFVLGEESEALDVNALLPEILY